MIELGIVWGIPLLFLLMSSGSSFFQNWRFFICLAFAVYFSLWGYPLFFQMSKDFVQKEFIAHVQVLATAAPALLFFMILWQMTGQLASHGGGGYHLPTKKHFSVWIMALLSGLIFSGFIGFLIGISPIHSTITSDVKLAEKSISRLNILTGFIDAFSLQAVHPAERRQLLLKRLTPLKKEEKPEKTGKKPEKIENPEKTEKEKQNKNMSSGPEIAKLQGEEWGVQDTEQTNTIPLETADKPVNQDAGNKGVQDKK